MGCDQSQRGAVVAGKRYTVHLVTEHGLRMENISLEKTDVVFSVGRLQADIFR